MTIFSLTFLGKCFALYAVRGSYLDTNLLIVALCVCHQSGVEFDALSDGQPYPTPLHQTSRGCGQLFTVLLELPAPPWVGAHMYTHSTGLYCVAMGTTGCVFVMKTLEDEW